MMLEWFAGPGQIQLLPCATVALKCHEMKQDHDQRLWTCSGNHVLYYVMAILGLGEMRSKNWMCPCTLRL